MLALRNGVFLVRMRRDRPKLECFGFFSRVRPAERSLSLRAFPENPLRAGVFHDREDFVGA